LASNGEGSLEQATEGNDRLYVAQLTGVAPVFIGNSGFGQVLRYLKSGQSCYSSYIILEMEVGIHILNRFDNTQKHMWTYTEPTQTNYFSNCSNIYIQMNCK
jgi:hypothetical protein